MVHCIGIMHDGEALEYSHPIDEPIHNIVRDTRHFVTIEIVSVEYDA
jgi:hypothetical protein